jgi:hypothetical protein
LLFVEDKRKNTRFRFKSEQSPFSKKPLNTLASFCRCNASCLSFSFQDLANAQAIAKLDSVSPGSSDDEHSNGKRIDGQGGN